jgi:hypothetical protein
MIPISVFYFVEVKNNFMDGEKVRSIRLPEYVWDALDRDAARCRRSSQKQIEAILVTIYKVDDVELDKEALALAGDRAPKPQKVEILGEIDPKGGKELPYFEIELGENKKKKRA